MTSKLADVLESKRAYRARLAALPIGEKLRMLDLLRERCLDLANVRRTAGFAPSLFKPPPAAS